MFGARCGWYVREGTGEGGTGLLKVDKKNNDNLGIFCPRQQQEEAEILKMKRHSIA